MTDVKLHDIGEGMTEAEVLRFFVKLDEHVEVDEPLFEVQTDKMTAELPSPTAGVVKEIKANLGDMIEVGTTVMILEGEQESLSSENTTPPDEIPVIEAPARPSYNQEAAVSKPKSGHVLAAPYTRKIARDLQVDIEQITGSGADGRVTEEDVQAFASQGSHEKKPAESAAMRPIATPAARKRAREHGIDLAQVKTQDPYGRIRAGDLDAPPSAEPQEADEIPFRGRRRAIAKKMAESVYTIPHVTHFDEVDVTELFALKQSLKVSRPQKNASAAAFFIKALQKALQEVPIFNAKLDEDNEVIRLQKTYHIGIATDMEEGLIVPVIHNVEGLSVTQIHEQMKTLMQKAQDHQLKAADMSKGTFTVSNVGPLGSTGATPIINAPEVGLMAFHKTKKTPVVREREGEDEIVIRNMMNVSMTFDHRVADGGQAVQFTNRFAEYIENPNLLFVDMV